MTIITIILNTMVAIIHHLFVERDLGMRRLFSKNESEGLRDDRLLSLETKLKLTELEDRSLPSVNANLLQGVLTINASGNNNILVTEIASNQQLQIIDNGITSALFQNSAVNQINVNSGNGNNIIQIDNSVLQTVKMTGGSGVDDLIAGGVNATIQGGSGIQKEVGGLGSNILIGGTGKSLLIGNANSTNQFISNSAQTQIIDPNPNSPISSTLVTSGSMTIPSPVQQASVHQILTTTDVQQLIMRASAASVHHDAIIAIVDRGGRILGVGVENGVSPNVQMNPALLTFSIDGAVAEARTGAMFSSNSAPITSRTVQEISQSTITQRQVESTPDLGNNNSPYFGPGAVAPIGLGGHFPPGIALTPPVDLFGIEFTNRASVLHTGSSGNRFAPGDVQTSNVYNVPQQYVPAGVTIPSQESYGFVSGLLPDAQSRGIGTLPGGIPIYKNGQLVGGIGVFFPGVNGFADNENSVLSANYNPNLPDRSLEAEWIAFAAVGGIPGENLPVGSLGNIPPVAGIGLPSVAPNRIDLVGITLNIFGPDGTLGPSLLKSYGGALGQSYANVHFMPVTTGTDGKFGTAGSQDFIDGQPVASGWLVTPHAGGNISAQDVINIVTNAINQANQTRSALRLPLSKSARMIFAVSDPNGNILGLYRMPDAATFSINVAVTKARNNAYYANPAQLQSQDQVPGVPAGTAFSSRTFRYLALPRFPSAIDGAPPGPFSILNDGGTSSTNAMNLGPPLPASSFQSVYGYNSFNPDTNFHDPYNKLNQSGVVFFPGGVPLYGPSTTGYPLIGGLGVSGDGVDQDDVVTYAAAQNFAVPPNILRADQTSYLGVNLPYQKFDRNPTGGVAGI